MRPRWTLMASIITLSHNCSCADKLESRELSNFGRLTRLRRLRIASVVSNPSSEPSASSAPSMTPSASLFTVPEFTRTVSASPTNSIAASLESNQDEEHPKPSVKHSWSVLLPVITMTIMAWAVKTNARFREHASACCTGDFCGADAREIPDEIVIQNKPSEACSVVGNGTKDIELMPVSTFDDASVLGSEIGRRAENAAIRWPAQIRRTRWNCVPEDPVDEISLKGSSFYVSSDDEDDYKEPKTSFARMK